MSDHREFLKKHGVNEALTTAVKYAIETKGDNPLGDLMKSLQSSFDARRFGLGDDLKGTFVVIGCSKGIGLELVKLAKAAGLEVYGTCRRSSEALSAVGIKKIIEGIELTEEDCGDKVKAALSGITIDTLVVNAAIGDADAGKEGSMIGKGMASQTLDAMSMANLRKMMEVNAYGLVKICKALVPLLKKNGGRLCTIGTIAASFAWTLDSPFSSGDFAPFISYRASKVAAMMITQSLAGPLKKDGIAVSVIHPGVGATDLTTAGLTPDGKPIIPDGMEGIFKWPDELAKGVMLAIKNTTLKTTGSFLDGQYGSACVTQPW